MKKFLQFVLEWKVGACIMYTATVIVYLAFCLLLGKKTVEVSLLWALLLASAVGTLIQTLCFTGLVIKKMRYTGRLALFCLLFFPVLAAVAWAFRWFPPETGAWLTFAAIFLLAFAGLTLGFEIYYRVAGRRYDGLLGQYRKAREEQEK